MPTLCGAASPVPCRVGKTRVKFFCVSLYAEKSHSIIGLVTTYGKNRRLGREPAGKPENPSIAVRHHTVIADIKIV